MEEGRGETDVSPGGVGGGDVCKLVNIMSLWMQVICSFHCNEKCGQLLREGTQ